MYEVDEDISVAKLEREIAQIEKTLDDALAGSEVADSFQTSVENTARTIQRRDDCTRTEALSMARAENPDAYERFQAEGIAKSTPGINRALGFEPLGVEGLRQGQTTLGQTRGTGCGRFEDVKVGGDE